MTPELFIALAAFALVSSITPGPNNLMLMASGANFGVKRTLPHLAGVLIGFNFMIWTVGAGLTRLFDAFPASYLVLKIASAVFLVYLAWKVATAAPLEARTETEMRAKPLTFLQAAAFQWVNPKAWALSLAANSAYAIEGDPLASVAFIAITFLVVGAPSVCLWLLLGTQIRRFLHRPWRLRAFNWICAALLLTSLWPILSTL